MPDLIATIALNVLVAGFAAWMAYVLAIRKMKREWERKSIDSRLSKAIKVSRDVRATLRSLTELQGLDGDQMQKEISDITKRIDDFHAEGRLGFETDFSNRVRLAYLDAKKQLQLIETELKRQPVRSLVVEFDPNSLASYKNIQPAGYYSTVKLLRDIDSEIEKYIDSLVKTVEI